jgi:hypothetical protein
VSTRGHTCGHCGCVIDLTGYDTTARDRFRICRPCANAAQKARDAARLSRSGNRAKSKGRSPAWDTRELGLDVAAHLGSAWGISSRVTGDRT